MALPSIRAYRLATTNCLDGIYVRYWRSYMHSWSGDSKYEIQTLRYYQSERIVSRTSFKCDEKIVINIISENVTIYINYFTIYEQTYN